ncbi:DNA polymerase epsilon subunit 2-like [Xenia sp. Carnegie-2017]|uniref:DNA polymerase epsilon subunit 2-like n=1 Tax=Xenia sp. Carnegie-2017 TaxID=2897299 RepID=UPI001F03D2CD|nr:DNA polymerase epsilon subunit 2-like [Xenia sp. Carnegie-2017]
MAARGRIVKTFKFHGLSLQSESSRFLGDVLSTVNVKDIDEWLDRIIESIQNNIVLSSTSIGKDLVVNAVEECSEGSEEKSDNVFAVIDAFEVPRYEYNVDRKKYLRDTINDFHLHPTASCKAKFYQDRYMTIYQRTIRHELFAPPSVVTHPSQKTNKYELKPVEYLLGSTAILGKLIVLGMVTQIKEGKYYLEDPTGVVPVDLSKAKYHTGLFTENSFVLAEGVYEDGEFHVEALGCPPSEPSQVTRNYFGNINFFGGPSAVALKTSTKLRTIEEDNQEAMFVILSDVWLDLPKVMAKLRVLFNGYASVPPTLFIFCGNFISKPFGSKHSWKLRECFNDLSDLISEFPSLVESSRFVFVPGPQDPGPGNILPRPALPSCLTQRMKSKIPFTFFATNPCRIQYCSQEIVVFREDLVNKMCRTCIHLPKDLENIPSHLVKTIISQAHLAPLPHHVRPVYWNYDNALRIYPVPDLIILADKYHSYVQPTSLDCTCVNPGSFSKNEYSFKVYWPASREVEDSKIQD